MLYQKLHTSPFHPILPFLPCLRPTAVALAPLSSLRARSGHDLGEVAARQQGTAVPMLQPTEDLPRKPQPTASDVMSQGQFGEQVGPWSSMVIHPWSSMVIHGHPDQNSSGKVWLPLVALWYPLVPSGNLLPFAIENGHRNSGFTHKNADFP